VTSGINRELTVGRTVVHGGLRQTHKLTTKQIAGISKPGRYGDGDGLELQVSKWGSRAWVLRYQTAGVVRYMGLGGLRDVTLKQAREAARQARLLIREGKDPIDERRRAQQARLKATASRMTFQQCAEAYLREHSSSWRSAKHAEQWRQSIDRANRSFGKLDVAAIDVDTVVKFLAPIWDRTPETGSRTRGRVEAILDWAKARRFRDGENPARWQGHLEHLFKKVPESAHHVSMDHKDAPAFAAKLREHPGIGARALELCILTASRANEINGARWEEIDGNLWTRPGDRMKGGKPHTVPLSERALEILGGLKRDGSGFVFPGQKSGTHINKHTMRVTLEAMGVAVSVHGFRATFKTWAAERTGFPADVVEMALAHAGTKLEQAYQRGDLSAKRARLMQQWANYLAAPAVETEVTPIGGVA
jgi:integrase